MSVQSVPLTRWYGLLAELDGPEALLHAAREAHAAGYRDVEAYSPFPVEGVAETLHAGTTHVPLVVLMLLGQSLRPILLGVGLGIIGGYGLSRALNSLFFRIAVADPSVFVLIAGLMITAAITAAWAPARRVTRLDPQLALRTL